MRGKESVSARDLQMGAGEAYRESIHIVGRGEPALRLHVEAADNALAEDDDAYAWLERARPLSVLVVGAQTQWLRPLLAGTPDVRVSYVAPAAYRAAGQDVTIFDRWTPPEPSREPALYFAPPGGGWLTAGSDERRPIWERAGNHPVVLGVDPVTLRVDRARSYTAPGLRPIAESARGTALVYAEESPARRAVIVTFSAVESNLATAPGFPILVANALDWLAHPVVPEGARHPGLAPFSTAVTRVVAPDGSAVPFVRADASQYAVLRTPGLYAVEGGGGRSMLAVNASDPQRSNVSRTSIKPSAVAAAGGLDRPWWIGCALAAFALALAEWWTWQRRITV
jgi:hypothetical protein